jgi:hypothetical protein
VRVNAKRTRALVTGTGMMWINNFGFVVQALFIKENGTWDSIEVAKLQAEQVVIFSLGNFAGRILMGRRRLHKRRNAHKHHLAGTMADIALNRYSVQRVTLCVLVSTSFLVSQIIAQHVESVENLWVATTAISICYGATFCLLPLVVMDWFGLRNFGQVCRSCFFTCLVSDNCIHRIGV